MITAALLFTTAALQDPIKLGWHDELNNLKPWHVLAVENRPGVTAPARGSLKLSLSKVPTGWPYTFQWSGVQRDVTVDIGRHPFLAAQVAEVAGYGHLDIDVLDRQGKAVKTLRTSTLQAPGVCFIDLSKDLDPAVYRLRLRLIVGGPNEGCSVTYNWVRFTSKQHGERLLADPGFSKLAEDRKSF